MSSITGTPPPVFMPARLHEHSYDTDLLAVSVPTRGTFADDSGFEGDFDISPSEGVFLMGTLLRVLFAQKVYPNLQDNQRFVLLAIEVKGETTDVIGRIATFSGEVVVNE